MNRGEAYQRTKRLPSYAAAYSMADVSVHSGGDRNRKQVTVLFVDIVRSSELVRLFDAEVTQNIFSDVINRQIAIVKKFKGTVNQVMGDGIMCLFGAESPFEEHALRAVHAAQEMLMDIVVLQKHYKNISLRIRVGVNTGDVIIRKLDNDDYRAVFQATGETVHLTDRFLKKAKPNHMVVLQLTRDILNRYYHFKKVDNLQWGGSRVLPIYEPISLKDLKTTPLLLSKKVHISRSGSEEKLQKMMSSLERKKSQKIIWIYGVAGIGKTHLISRFIPKLNKDFFDKVIQVNFYPEPISEENAAFEKIILKNIFGQDRQKIYKEASQLEVRHLPFFDECIREILDLKVDSDSYTSLEVDAKLRFKVDIVSQLLLEVTSIKKILLVLEDMHWAHESALTYIETLFSLYRGPEHLFVLATSRNKPEFDRSINDTKIKKLLLEPLDSSGTLQMLNNMDIDKVLSAPNKKKICHLSGGNPYFVQEYFHWARNQIASSASQELIARRLGEQTPEHVANIFYNKLATLDDGAIHLAKLASIFGMHISFDLIRAVSGLSKEAIFKDILALERADVLRSSKRFPTPEWVFTHELLQKVIYSSIPRSARISWHHDVIKQLKKNQFNNLSDRHIVMASHAERSENALLRYIYSKWAAQKSMRLSLHRSAVRFSEDARRAILDIRNCRSCKRHELKMRLLEINSLFILGKFSAVNAHIEYLLKQKYILARFECLEPVLSFKELYLWVKGDLTGAVALSSKILSMNEEDHREEVYIRENARSANLYIDMGSHEKAVFHDLKVVRAVSDDDFERKFHLLTQAKPVALSRLTLCYAELGDVKKAKLFFDEAHHFLDKSRDYFTKIYVLTYLAHSLLVQNRPREASEMLKTALAYCETTKSIILKPYVLSALGLALARMAEEAEGLRLCKEALIQAASTKLILRVSQFKIWHAEVLMLQGHHSVAIQSLKKVIRVTEASREVARTAEAYYLLGRAYLKKEKVSERDLEYAGSYLQRALALSQENRLVSLKKKIQEQLNHSLLEQKVKAFFG